jgi:hypothetical protein
MKILFAGIIGRYPWGGVTWCSLMYLLGLRQLGHDVFYIEDTCECNYDPEKNSIRENPSYAVRYIGEVLSAFELGNCWSYVDHLGRHHGQPAETVRRYCADADLFLVLSGGCWIWRDHYLAIPHRVFVDSDPAFTQLALDRAREKQTEDVQKNWYLDFFTQYTTLFTFGSNIGTPHCAVPVGPLRWHHTWQPVCTDLWKPKTSPLPSRHLWTTLMTWQIKSFEDIGGNKDSEFLKILSLSESCRRVGIEIEIAVNGPLDLLRDSGWRCINAMSISSNPWLYHHYITSSRAEFSVAKHTYVSTNSGWFSDRTICYLASGKPAVVQQTGFTNHLPSGEGLFAWTTQEEALEAMKMVERDYAHHSARAREITMDCFRSEEVLSSLLKHIT